MSLKDHLNKKAFHHAYLIEGTEEEVLPEILTELRELEIEVKQNPNIYKISLDSFKMEDARNLKSSANLKGFSEGKKIFIISSNSFLLEAQNAMLKIFEEPTEDSHFFIITPSLSGLLPTFVSRFYTVKREDSGMSLKEAEEFIKSSPAKRIDLLKELLKEEDEEEAIESVRSKALKFLNSLETVLHKKFSSDPSSDAGFFYQIFKVREYLRQPGSSAKSLMESVALSIPNF